MVGLNKLKTYTDSASKSYIIYDDSDNNIYFQLTGGNLVLVVVAAGVSTTIQTWGSG